MAPLSAVLLMHFNVEVDIKKDILHRNEERKLRKYKMEALLEAE